ncbi:MAG: DUF4286 family protein [Kofleriaceae bacterium]|nr:DUF4286 family protein [Kofleriaceae bacterium]
MPHVIYEVNLDIDAAVADAYRAWLTVHIDELLTLPGFLEATCFDVRDPAPSAGRVALCVQYQLRDRAALDDYLRDHAPRMRADGLQRFGDAFRATRRILVPDAHVTRRS